MEVLVNIDVPDLGAGIAFYTNALGLSIRRRFGGGGVELTGAGTAIFLLQKDEGSLPLPSDPHVTRSYRRHWCPVHVDFVVPDIHLSVARAVAAGAVVEEAARERRWGWLALLADPFGNGFCFVQFVGRGYDEVADA